MREDAVVVLFVDHIVIYITIHSISQDGKRNLHYETLSEDHARMVSMQNEIENVMPEKPLVSGNDQMVDLRDLVVVIEIVVVYVLVVD